MNIFLFIGSAHTAYKDVKIQKKYLRETIVPYLANLENTYNGNFSAHQKFKILNYYGLLTPVILCINFRRLHNQPFTDAERQSATFTGLSTCVLDDLFDDRQTSIEQIRKITLEPDTVLAKGFFENAARKISSFLLHTAADKTAYKAIIEKMLEIQAESLRQFDPEISSSDLVRITYEKAAFSFTFYATHMMGEVSEAFNEVLYHIGGLQQYCNDLQDILKDAHQKIVTPANLCRDFTAFRIEFIEKIRVQNQKIMALPFPRKNKEQFCIMMSTIHAAAVAFIDILIKIEKKKGKGLDWNEFTRQDLMFDHEKMSNTIKWFYYIMKLSKLR